MSENGGGRNGEDRQAPQESANAQSSTSSAGGAQSARQFRGERENRHENPSQRTHQNIPLVPSSGPAYHGDQESTPRGISQDLIRTILRIWGSDTIDDTSSDYERLTIQDVRSIIENLLREFPENGHTQQTEISARQSLGSPAGHISQDLINNILSENVRNNGKKREDALISQGVNEHERRHHFDYRSGRSPTRKISEDLINNILSENIRSNSKKTTYKVNMTSEYEGRRNGEDGQAPQDRHTHSRSAHARSSTNSEQPTAARGGAQSARGERENRHENPSQRTQQHIPFVPSSVTAHHGDKKSTPRGISQDLIKSILRRCGPDYCVARTDDTSSDFERLTIQDVRSIIENLLPEFPENGHTQQTELPVISAHQSLGSPARHISQDLINNILSENVRSKSKKREGAVTSHRVNEHERGQHSHYHSGRSPTRRISQDLINNIISENVRSKSKKREDALTSRRVNEHERQHSDDRSGRSPARKISQDLINNILSENVRSNSKKREDDLISHRVNEHERQHSDDRSSRSPARRISQDLINNLISENVRSNSKKREDALTSHGVNEHERQHSDDRSGRSPARKISQDLINNILSENVRSKKWEDALTSHGVNEHERRQHFDNRSGRSPTRKISEDLINNILSENIRSNRKKKEDALTFYRVNEHKSRQHFDDRIGRSPARQISQDLINDLLSKTTSNARHSEREEKSTGEKSVIPERVDTPHPKSSGNATVQLQENNNCDEMLHTLSTEDYTSLDLDTDFTRHLQDAVISIIDAIAEQLNQAFDYILQTGVDMTTANIILHNFVQHVLANDPQQSSEYNSSQGETSLIYDQLDPNLRIVLETYTNTIRKQLRKVEEMVSNPEHSKRVLEMLVEQVLERNNKQSVFEPSPENIRERIKATGEEILQQLKTIKQLLLELHINPGTVKNILLTYLHKYLIREERETPGVSVLSSEMKQLLHEFIVDKIMKERNQNMEEPALDSLQLRLSLIEDIIVLFEECDNDMMQEPLWMLLNHLQQGTSSSDKKTNSATIKSTEQAAKKMQPANVAQGTGGKHETQMLEDEAPKKERKNSLVYSKDVIEYLLNRIFEKSKKEDSRTEKIDISQDATESCGTYEVCEKTEPSPEKMDICEEEDKTQEYCKCHVSQLTKKLTDLMNVVQGVTQCLASKCPPHPAQEVFPQPTNNNQCCTFYNQMPNGMTMHEFDNLIEQWFSEQLEFENLFYNQADEITRREFRQAENREKLNDLYTMVQSCTHHLDFVDHEINTLENMEHEIEAYCNACYDPCNKYVRAHSGEDIERDKMYTTLTDLQQYVGLLSTGHEELEKTAANLAKSSNTTKIILILNHFTNNLTWIEHRIQRMESELNDIKYMHSRFRQDLPNG